MHTENLLGTVGQNIGCLSWKKDQKQKHNHGTERIRYINYCKVAVL